MHHDRENGGRWPCPPRGVPEASKSDAPTQCDAGIRDPGGGNGSNDQVFDAQKEGSVKRPGVGLRDRAGCRRRSAQTGDLQGVDRSFGSILPGGPRLASVGRIGRRGRAAHAGAAGRANPEESGPGDPVISRGRWTRSGRSESRRRAASRSRGLAVGTAAAGRCTSSTGGAGRGAGRTPEHHDDRREGDRQDLEIARLVSHGLAWTAPLPTS
jgi:hypothetical protein